MNGFSGSGAGILLLCAPPKHRPARKRAIEKSFQLRIFGETGPGPEFRCTYGREEDERIGIAQFHPLCNNRGITVSGDFDENVGIDEDRHRLPNLSTLEPLRSRLTSSLPPSFSACDLRIPTNPCIAALRCSRSPSR